MSALSTCCLLYTSEARRELFNLRFQLATGRLDNIARIPEVRREIARLLTLQGERARSEEN